MKKKSIMIGGGAGALAVALAVSGVAITNSNKNKNVPASGDVASVAELTDESTPLAATPDASEESNEEAAPVVSEEDVQNIEVAEEVAEEEEEAVSEEEAAAATETTVLFKEGAAKEFETTDLDWFYNAADDDVLTIVYTCTDATHSGWGVLGFGANKAGSDAWLAGPELKADGTDATKVIYATVTIKQLKKAFGVSDASDITFLKLGAWNGGKIVSITLSTKENAKDVAAKSGASVSSEAVELAEEEDTTVVATPGTSGSVSGQNLGVVNKAVIVKVPNTCGAEDGDTVKITAVLNSSDFFNGTIGMSDLDGNWKQAGELRSDGGTVTWTLTVENAAVSSAELQLWWSNTNVGLNSVSMSVVAKGQGSSVSGQDLGVVNSAVIVKIPNTCGAEDGDTVRIVATLDSADFYNGTMGMSDLDGNWKQAGELRCNGGTATWSLTVENAAVGSGELQVWWSNKKVGLKSVSMVLVSKKAETDEEPAEEENQGEESGEQGGNTNPGTTDPVNPTPGTTDPVNPTPGTDDKQEESAETVIFANGGVDESFESYEAAVAILAADDSDVITLVYSCADETHAYWGILGIGASVGSGWNQIEFAADGVNPTGATTVTMTVAELKEKLGVDAENTMTWFKVSCYNGGQLISLSITPAQGEEPETPGEDVPGEENTEEGTQSEEGTEGSGEGEQTEEGSQTEESTEGTEEGSQESGEEAQDAIATLTRGQEYWVDLTEYVEGLQTGDNVSFEATLVGQDYFNGCAGGNSYSDEFEWGAWVSGAMFEGPEAIASVSIVVPENGEAKVKLELWWTNGENDVVTIKDVTVTKAE